ncbi:hypothetical protein BC938DRAFT_484285 [Jimgerdemannia flammicorona]|uniref:Uncharacterized protein n=1 Tax=Jimgerdemannia flammicorona TaxID=994334 RepID=A0A433QA46_9FUNG|nr:hypothetical protein BC938DRAFT_484285 [Jimgerdemannia flammicorona]
MYGFRHIIVVGEVDFGMLFMECYGRVFRFDDMVVGLWVRGGSIEEAIENPWNQVEWAPQSDATIMEVKHGMRRLFSAFFALFLRSIIVHAMPTNAIFNLNARARDDHSRVPDTPHLVADPVSLVDDDRLYLALLSLIE